MATVKYMWGTIYGTDAVPCEVKEKHGDTYRIEFFDTIRKQIDSRWVRHDDLVFPRFADIVCP